MVMSIQPNGPMTSYGGDAYNGAYQTLLQQVQGLHSDSGYARQMIGTRLNTATDQFKSSFSNLVGRDPTQDEINQFLSQSAGSLITSSNGGTGRSENDQQSILNQINQFVGQNFHKAAQDYATQQLQDQQGQWQGLADTARSQGNDAINNVQSSLLDYQSKLFDRLRPNLLTSLKAQGLLDTGGLNEAEAGVQGDLANNASQYIAGLKYQNETNANNISLGGKAAPIQFAQSNATGQPDYLTGVSNGAMGFNNGTYMDNLNYQHQLGLIGAQTSAQASLQPSFMRTLGQSFASNFGSTVGSNVGNQIVPSGGGKSTGFMSMLG
jgi:hypothetical protein